MPICRQCKHADYTHRVGDCMAVDATGQPCGCVKFQAWPKREDRSRTWIVKVSVFEFNKWMPDVELRVKAQGIGGAAMKAVRQVKHARTSKRRIMQTRITVVPVPRSGS